MTRYAGIDAHTGDLHVTVLEEAGEEVDHFTVTNEAVDFEQLTDRLHPDDHVGIEACDPAYPVVEHPSGTESRCKLATRRSSAR